MGSAASPDGPLQIISFVKDTDDSERKDRLIKIHNETLDKIFSLAGDRKVAILSIAGPSRKGKSFFLDFVLRYLEALENDEADWMDWENKDKPLKGFKWVTQTEPETSGIVMWSRPFIVKGENEIAIFLMDTQGTYDKYTTEREMTSIVGLSLLSSSCLIFNFFNSLQEDLINSLETYITYGLLALGGESEEDGEIEKPFQKLLFLIRDWQMPTQHPFGLKGGKAYLKKEMELIQGLTPAGKRIRQALDKCFSELECCLLPPLGEKAMQEGFNGSLSQLSNSFCKKLEELISDLLNPDDLPLKSVCGNEVRATDVPEYLKKYVEIFNEETLPSPENMMEATAKISNETSVNKAIRKYKESMKKKMRGKQFFSDDQMKKHNKASFEDAVKEFRSVRKIGSKEMVEEYEEKLKDKIQKEIFSQINKENKEKKEKAIGKAIGEMETTYKEKMIDEFEDEFSFLEERKLKSLSTTAKDDAFSDIMDKLVDCGEKELDEIGETVKKVLHQLEDNLLMENKNRKLTAEKKMEDSIVQITSLYCQDLQEILEEKGLEFDEADLEEHDKENRQSFLQRFDKEKKPGKKDFQQQYFDKLVGIIQSKYEDISRAHSLKLKEAEAASEETINSIITEVSENFQKSLSFETAIAEPEKLEESKIDFLKDAETTLQSLPDLAPKLVTKLLPKLRSNLDQKLDLILSEFIIECKETQEHYEKAAATAFSTFEESVKALIASSFLEEDELEKELKEMETKAIDNYKAEVDGKGHPNPSEILEQLEEKLTQEIEEVKDRNDERKSALKSETRNLVHEAHRNYEGEMIKNLELAKDQDHFEVMHKEAKKVALSFLSDNCKIKSPSFLQEFEAELISEIDTTLEDTLKEVMELKLLERDSGTTSAISEARKFYNEEMEKHYKNNEFMRPKDLKELHENMAKLSVDKAKEKVPLSQIQLQDLRSALDQSFEKYKEINKMNVPVDPAIGIDLGTTYSCVGVYLNGNVKIIPNAQGKNTTPSYVSYKDNGHVDCVGIPAKENAPVNAETTVYDAKRILGRSFEDPVLQNDMKLWPFTVVDDRQIPKIEVGGKKLFPEQVSSEILKEMRVAAEKYLNCTVKNAVITVPAYFSDGQRQATIDAGELAGLKVLNILSEPVSAAVAYKLQHSDDLTRHVLIFDLGGGTYDVAALKMQKGKIETLAVDGDTHLGGEDFDQNMMRYCALEFQRVHGIDLMEGKDSPDMKTRSECRRRLKRLQLLCEKRKMDLSSCRSVEITLDSIYTEQGLNLDLHVKLTREKFEQMNEDLFDKTIEIVERCLDTARIGKERIDDIVLVGGSTRIPKVQELLSEFFEGKALNRTINPDEAVAFGAAVQAAIMNGQIAMESTDFNKIQDVTPMSLGVEVYGGGFSIIIPKNSKIPMKFKEQYRTAHNNQTSVQITVYQGEKDVAKENIFLGDFYLNNIPPADAGRETIDVTMEINLQGVLHVRAVCTSTGEQGSITVTENKRRMGKEEIKRILGEAQPGAA